MAGVTGIGGVFFKARDPVALQAWYHQHLGVPVDPAMGGMAIIRWEEDAQPDGGKTVWHLARQDTDWFEPSPASFMINYRVVDLATLLARLTESGVPIQQGPEEHFNGTFAWIMDPEGNKVELWEPKAPN